MAVRVVVMVVAVVVVVIVITLAVASVAHVGTFDATDATKLATLHHVGPFAVPAVVVVVPGLSALHVSTIGLATPAASVVPVVLLVVVVLVEASVTVPGRWLLLLLLLMRRVIVLVLMRVMVVLMIHMIYPRIAGGAIIQLASIAPTSATCRNHHLLVIAGEVPLQVMLLLLLLRGLLWVQLLIEIAIVKMGIATEERRSLGGRGRRRLRRRSTTPRHSHAHIVQKVQTVLRRCGGCGWNRLLLLLLLLRLLLMVVSDGGM